MGLGLPSSVSFECLQAPFESASDALTRFDERLRSSPVVGAFVLGGISKMGQRDIRRLLIAGAMAVVRWACRKEGAAEGSWLARMLARKPRKLVAITLANKMARAVWAMLTRNEDYRQADPVPA